MSHTTTLKELSSSPKIVNILLDGEEKEEIDKTLDESDNGYEGFAILSKNISFFNSALHR